MGQDRKEEERAGKSGGDGEHSGAAREAQPATGRWLRSVG